jgi:hypothetical protein
MNGAASSFVRRQKSVGGRWKLLCWLTRQNQRKQPTEITIIYIFWAEFDVKQGECWLFDVD